MQLAYVAGAVAVALVYSYATITYVYRDAPRRGMDAGQWSGIMAVTVGTAMVVYLAVRDPIRAPEDRRGPDERRAGPDTGPE